MKFSFEVVVFFILLIDSVTVSLIAWLGGGYRWYPKALSRYFPLAKGWSTYYLILVLWVGFLLYRFRILTF